MGRRPGPTLAVVLACLIAGCATLNGAPERPTPGPDLDRAIVAWRTGDYRTAHEALLRVYNGYADEPAGRRALLALAALELDPRGPGRRPDRAAEFLARYLHTPDSAAWLEPMAETLYLLALDLGAQPTADSLPLFPGTPLAVRIQELEQQRDSLAAHIDALGRKLADSERELQRIRATLKH